MGSSAPEPLKGSTEHVSNVSSSGSTGEGSNFKLTHMVGSMTPFLKGCGTEGQVLHWWLSEAAPNSLTGWPLYIAILLSLIRVGKPVDQRGSINMMEVTAFYKFNLAVTSHHISRSLLVRSQSYRLAHAQEEGIPQGHDYRASGPNLLSTIGLTIFCSLFATI